MVLVYKQVIDVTAHCAAIEPRQFFESAAKRHFQKIVCITQTLNRLYLVD